MFTLTKVNQTKDKKIKELDLELAECHATTRKYPPWMAEKNKVQARIIDNLEAQVRQLEF